MPVRSSLLGAARLGLLALLLAAPASATTVVRQSLPSLVAQSELVVRGVVERVELHDPEGGPPFHLAFVRITEDAFAEPGPTPSRTVPARIVPVRLPGGMTASGLQCAVAGTPRLAAGDDVVLFLSRVPSPATARPSRPAARELAGALPARAPQPREQWQPVALSLGTWRVQAQPEGPVLRRDPAASGLHQVEPPPGAGGGSGGVSGDGASLPDGQRVADVLQAARELRRARGTR